MGSFTNVWSDQNPPNTEAVSLGASEMRKIRVDVEQRLAQALCGTSANLPTALEANFTNGSGSGMPYYATDLHKLYQLTSAGQYTEEAVLGHWLIDTSVNSFPSGGGTLNTVTIPSGFLTAPPYFIEIDAYILSATNGSGGAPPHLWTASILFGGSAVSAYSSESPFGSQTEYYLQALVYVQTTSSQTSIAIPNVTQVDQLYNAPQALTVNTTGAVAITSAVSQYANNSQGGWLSVKIRK